MARQIRVLDANTNEVLYTYVGFGPYDPKAPILILVQFSGDQDLFSADGFDEAIRKEIERKYLDMYRTGPNSITPYFKEFVRVEATAQAKAEGKKFCPDCGSPELRLIESTQPDSSGEYKDISTCDKCQNMIYVFRHKKGDGGLYVDKKDGTCHECENGKLEIIGVDDSMMEVSCIDCGEEYSVEVDAFNDGGGKYWPEAMVKFSLSEESEEYEDPEE